MKEKTGLQELESQNFDWRRSDLGKCEATGTCDEPLLYRMFYGGIGEIFIQKALGNNQSATENSKLNTISEIFDSNDVLELQHSLGQLR